MGENPQFMLEIKSSGPTVVWILLSRHIVDIQDFAHNKEYITCHVCVYAYPIDVSRTRARIHVHHSVCATFVNIGAGGGGGGGWWYMSS